ncbi:hypothetical protein ACFELO_10790 [Oceanicaulis sp. LC35]|uniref:hypothetical protein n=1 Tax=Oceanicaulis sp. LC35 TaxID=3349635 RepID=UPI003F8499EC
MSLPSTLSSALGRDRLSDATRRGLPFGLALGLHAGLLALLISTPPGELLRIRGEVERLDVRFYTVSAADADSDAQLVEPPLSDEAIDPALEEPAPVDEAEGAEPPAPVAEASPSEPEPAPTQRDTVEAVSEDGLSAPSPEPASTRPRRARTGAAPAPGNASADAPVSTTQQRPGQRRRAPPPPSFADILARAETRLDPDDFRIVLSLDGVREAVRESFCLSSSAANLEAGECPDGPNPDSARLAQFGLQGLGEEPPEFLEDMDRMAFQLQQLGANPSQVERIMLALRESRRDAINTPGVNRAMQRDLESRTDNLGNPLPGPD